MYAVIHTGGKQHRVSPGDVIAVEKLEGREGDVVEIPSVLMVGSGTTIAVGQPRLEAARVLGRIVKQTKGPKIIVYKHKRRKGYQKKQGHRQRQTLLQVTEIVAGPVLGQA